jgi:hypothetical protein
MKIEEVKHSDTFKSKVQDIQQHLVKKAEKVTVPAKKFSLAKALSAVQKKAPEQPKPKIAAPAPVKAATPEKKLVVTKAPE